MTKANVPRIDFYFDYLSGYAYLAWFRVVECCTRREIPLGIHPVLFAGLLDHWGQLGPAEIPPKRAYVYRDGYRLAATLGLPFAAPKFHPFNPLPALRVSLQDVAGKDQRRVVDALWRAGWGRGIDMGSTDDLRAALDEEGLDGAALLRQVDKPEIKAALRGETDRAIARGVFGVPTVLAGDEIFWGQDSIPWLELYLDGRDPLDRDAVERILARPEAVMRPGAKQAGAKGVREP